MKLSGFKGQERAAMRFGSNRSRFTMISIGLGVVAVCTAVAVSVVFFCTYGVNASLINRVRYAVHRITGKERVLARTAREASRHVEKGKAGASWYQVLGEWEYYYGNIKKAEALLQEGVRRSAQGDMSCYSSLAELLVSQGRSVEVIDGCPAWIDRDSHYYEWIGQLESRAGHYDRAKERYRLALKLLDEERERRLSVLGALANVGKNVSAADSGSSSAMAGADYRKRMELELASYRSERSRIVGLLDSFPD